MLAEILGRIVVAVDDGVLDERQQTLTAARSAVLQWHVLKADVSARHERRFFQH